MEIFVPLVGVGFRGKPVKELVARLHIGEDRFEFVCEPENDYDPHAVKVMFHEEIDDEPIFIGYVAKENNYPLFRAIEDGEEPVGRIVSFENTYKPLLLIQW